MTHNYAGFIASFIGFYEGGVYAELMVYLATLSIPVMQVGGIHFLLYLEIVLVSFQDRLSRYICCCRMCFQRTSSFRLCNLEYGQHQTLPSMVLGLHSGRWIQYLLWLFWLLPASPEHAGFLTRKEKDYFLQRCWSLETMPSIMQKAKGLTGAKLGRPPSCLTSGSASSLAPLTMDKRFNCVYESVLVSDVPDGAILNSGCSLLRNMGAYRYRIFFSSFRNSL